MVTNTGKIKTHMKVRNRGCKYCQGDLYEDEGGLKCLQCGRPEKVFVVPDLSGMSLWPKGLFYDEHVEEILADLKNLGAKGMREKWQMSPTGWFGIKRRWRKTGIVVDDAGERSPYGPQEKPRKPAVDKPKKEVSPGGAFEILAEFKIQKEMEYLRGYRDAVRDIHDIQGKK